MRVVARSSARDSMSDEHESGIEYPVYDEVTVAELVQRASEGDRVHIELRHREGEVPWHSAWVTDAGDDYVETDRFRVEVTDPDAVGRDAVTLLEAAGDEYVNASWTEALNGFERTPRDAFSGETWYTWEVAVSEAMGGGASTDQTMFPEAPSRAVAEETAKRWAGMENGHTPTVYREGEIDPPTRTGDQEVERPA